jgi:nucleoside-diphosphate-sugar epimerase
MKNVLITGAGGEVGYTLITELKKKGCFVVATSLHKLPPESEKECNKYYQVDVIKKSSLSKVFEKHNFDIIFHLASILSTGGEKSPESAIDVNTLGSINTLELATQQALKTNKQIVFIFPSSIAAYGMENIKTKKLAGKVKGNKFLNPITIYGITKIFTEKLGYYFSKNYKLLSDIKRDSLIDFRCVRFPGLLSPDTVPSGGTSDYGPEMIHSAAQNKSYTCFVRPDSKIPFMAMADAVRAIIELSQIPKAKLSTQVYNIAGFSVSAKDIEVEVKKLFPKTKITYKVDKIRQSIVDSWPEDVNDNLAKRDWDWKANFNFQKTFEKYLLPNIIKRYSKIEK